MTERIYKYAVPAEDEFAHAMPAGARVLSVQTQKGWGYIWALVDTDKPEIKRAFALRGTGHPADGLQGAAFVGSFQLQGGDLVFHLFDRGEIA